MDFKILCIDDEPTWVESIRGDIETHLRGLGYDPEIIVRENGKDVDSFLHRHDINLIMIDYNLPEHKGDELVKYVLKKGNFVELIFYSEEEAAVQRSLGTHIHLVHIKARSDVQALVIELCTFSDYRYKNVDVMRGLVVAESISLEGLLEEIMVKTFRDHGERFQYEVLNKGRYDFQKKCDFVLHYLNDQEKKLEKAYTDGGKKDQALLKKKEAIQTNRTRLKDFSKDVVKPRNVVAHGKKIIRDDGRAELIALDKAEENIVFDKGWITGSREKLSSYRDVLTSILALDIY